MQGVVRFVNNDDALVAVETEHGKYTVFGLMGDYPIKVGDVVSGPLEKLDQQQIVNQTQDVTMQVYVEDVELPLEAAREKVG